VRFLKFFIRLFISLIAALLVSCIDGQEEFWFEADGSGRADLTYTLPAAAAITQGGEAKIRERISGFLQNTPEIIASSHEVSAEGNRLRIRIQAQFNSAQKLSHRASAETLRSLPAAVAHLAGTVDVDIDGRNLEFTRIAKPGLAIPGSMFFPSARLDGHQLTYIMHLPSAAIESNATRIEDSGRTLIWNVPLAQAVRQPVVTRFKTTVPIPWHLVSSVVLPITLLGGFAAIKLRKSRHNH
jgi:hypothetical protein